MLSTVLSTYPPDSPVGEAAIYGALANADLMQLVTHLTGVSVQLARDLAAVTHREVQDVIGDAFGRYQFITLDADLPPADDTP